MDRRDCMRASGTSALAAAVGSLAVEASAAQRPKTYVLACGIWLGGWRGPATGPGWKLIDLPTDLMGMMTHPDTVAAAFANLG